MFTNTTFTYDGVSSDNFGMSLVNLNTGSRNSHFGVSRSIREEKNPYREEPFFLGLDYEPLQFQATFAREEEWTRDDRLAIARWLFQDSYKPFVSTDDAGIIYNAMVVDSPEKIMIGNLQRMIQLTFRCDAPWAWTPTYIQNYDLSNNTTTTFITLNNESNIKRIYRPEIEIQKVVAGGNVTLTNLSNNNQEFILTDLLNNETIYINNSLKQITSDQADRYPLLNFNRNWLELVYGENNIEVSGECMIQTKMKYPIGV